MGMLGAMAGVGRGIQGYAQSMKDTQKMNWMAKQDQAKHERQMNLEQLRQSGMSQRAKDEQGFRTSERVAGQEATSLEFDRRRGIQVEDTKSAQDYAIKTQGIQFDQNLKKQQEALKTRLETTSAQELKNTEDMYKFTEGLSIKKREEQVDSVKASPAFQALSEKEQQAVLFSLEHPEAANALAVIGKGVKDFPIEQYRLAYKDASEQWDRIDKNEKATIQNRAASLGFEDPADIRDYYASTTARQATNLDKMIEAGPVEADAGSTTGDNMSVQEAVGLAKAGSVTAKEVDTAVRKGIYTEAEGQEIKKALPTTGSTPALKGTSKYNYGRPGRILPDAIHRLGDTSQIAPVADERVQYLKEQRGAANLR